MNVQTFYSILQALVSPEKIVKACKEAGYSQLILCDRNSMSGVVEFYEACKDKKVGIKPILGTCLKVCEMDSSIKDEFNTIYNICLVAKNNEGYRNILKIISLANDPKRVLETKYQQLARFSLEEIKGLTKGVACILADGSEWEAHKVDYTLEKYRTYFDEVLTSDEIYWADVRYLDKAFEEDWEVAQCVLLKCLLEDLPRIAKEIGSPLKRDNSLPSLNTYQSSPLYKRTEDFLNSCEEYEILSPPKIPKFDCPDGMSQQEYLTELCRQGWKRRFPKWESQEKKTIYAERVKKELGVLQRSGFDGYFLIIQDIVNWCKRQGWLIGQARGSASGSLVSYLIGIVEIDAVLHDIPFERFLQEGRGSLPDIDIDFPREKRELVVKYIKEKFGEHRVAHICTFGTLLGSSALAAVLKAHDIFDNKMIESITKKIPKADKVSDKMQEQGEESLIRFTLKNFPETLKSLGYIENDVIYGENAYHLEQAIRLEGIITNVASHASGILIYDEAIENAAPLIVSPDGKERYCAFSMGPAEKAGLVKADILGLATLDILMEVINLLMGRSEDQ